jgi:NAD(P)-dependent dehydrogenase (short-subunit alcohol dehydrogenase family)
MRLQGKVAVITGAASGMGLAMATLFAAEGAAVVMGDYNLPRLEEAVAKISAAGGAITYCHGDIAQQASAECLIDTAIKTHGRVNVLVNNAGVMDHFDGVAELSNELWRRVMGINLDGPMYTMRAAIPHMISNGGGHIINIASTAGISGGAAGAAYTASKHALVGLTKSTAWLYAPQGIRCNAIAPGGTKTNIGESMNAALLNPVGMARTGQFSALIPLMLEASDIATLALFLASDESHFLNGTVIPADGGWKAL